MRAMFFGFWIFLVAAGCSKDDIYHVKCPDGKAVSGRVDSLPEYRDGMTDFGNSRDWDCLSSTYLVFYSSGKARVDFPGNDCIKNSVSFLLENGINVQNLNDLPSDINAGVQYKNGKPELCQIVFLDWKLRLLGKPLVKN